MALVANEDGYQLHVWPNDHPPPHVHVRRAGAEMRIEIGTLVGEAPKWMSHSKGILEADVRFALRLVHKHQSACLTMWRRFHGN